MQNFKKVVVPLATRSFIQKSHYSGPILRPQVRYDTLIKLNHGPLVNQYRRLRVGKKQDTARTTTTYQEESTDSQLTSTQKSSEPYQQQQSKVDYSKEPKAGTLLEADQGLQSFIQNVMVHTAGGLALTGFSASLFVMGVLPMPGFGLTVGLGLIGGLACLFGALGIQPQYIKVNGHIATQNTPARLALASGFYLFQGILLAPLLAISPPSLVLAAALITGGVVAGMGALALSRPSGSMLSWGGPLTVGLIGLLVCSLGSMFFPSPAMTMMISVGGLGLFAAFTAYDIQKAIHDYRSGLADHVGHALNLYLDIINIFKNLLWILNMFWND